MGVPDGSTLLVVDSDKIQDNNHTTRYSCVIKTPDGKVENADMLKQIGGKDSDKNVYETNRDGSKVEKQNVQSSFAIDSPLIENGIITIKKGQLGFTEVGCGEMDRTSHNDAFTQRLETRQMYPVTSRVREEFSQNKGTDNIPNKMREIEKNEKNGRNQMSLKDADGNFRTGNINGNEAAKIILNDEGFVDRTNGMYTQNDIKERFEHMQEKNPNASKNELIELTEEDLIRDADFMPTRERGV